MMIISRINKLKKRKITMIFQNNIKKKVKSKKEINKDKILI